VVCVRNEVRAKRKIRIWTRTPAGETDSVSSDRGQRKKSTRKLLRLPPKSLRRRKKTKLKGLWTTGEGGYDENPDAEKTKAYLHGVRALHILPFSDNLVVFLPLEKNFRSSKKGKDISEKRSRGRPEVTEKSKTAEGLHLRGGRIRNVGFGSQDLMA